MGTPAYDKAHARWINMKFNLKTDADILDYLDSKPNKQGYIKSLIRADIAAHSAEQNEAGAAEKKEGESS